ncbi:MAG: hypothetical protein AB1941_06170 [Gemmatimonadota bacterium]
MKSLREMVWEAVAFEMEVDTPMTGPTFTADDITAAVVERNLEELEAARVGRQDVRREVLAVLDHIEAHGWDNVRDEFQRAARVRKPHRDPEPLQRPGNAADPNDPPF